jgi:hypothetical protein
MFSFGGIATITAQLNANEFHLLQAPCYVRFGLDANKSAEMEFASSRNARVGRRAVPANCVKSNGEETGVTADRAPLVNG